MNRALREYWDAVPNPLMLNCHYDAPGTGTGVVEHGGRSYVVIRNDFRGVMAVFSVRADGQVKRLRRWPTAVAPV